MPLPTLLICRSLCLLVSAWYWFCWLRTFAIWRLGDMILVAGLKWLAALYSFPFGLSCGISMPLLVALLISGCFRGHFCYQLDFIDRQDIKVSSAIWKLTSFIMMMDSYHFTCTPILFHFASLFITSFQVGIPWYPLDLIVWLDLGRSPVLVYALIHGGLLAFDSLFPPSALRFGNPKTYPLVISDWRGLGWPFTESWFRGLRKEWLITNLCMMHFRWSAISWGICLARALGRGITCYRSLQL